MASEATERTLVRGLLSRRRRSLLVEPLMQDSRFPIPACRRKVVWGRAVRIALLLAIGLGSLPVVASAQVYSLAWDANSDPYTVGYKVFAGTRSGVYPWSVDVGNATVASLPDLSQAGTYYFAVRGYNDSGQLGPASAELVVTVGPPGAPPGLSVSATGSRVTLTWGIAPGLIPAANYLLYIGTSPGAANIVSGYPVGNQRSVSGDLGPGRYYARVQASNRYGAGPISPEVSFDVGGAGVPASPTGLGQTWQGTVVTLTWNAAAGATSYVIEAGSRSGVADLARISTGSNRLSVDVPPGTFYVRVRAVSAAGESAPSNEIVVRGQGTPLAPSALSATTGASSVTLRWSGPPNGPAPTGYLLEAGSAPGSANLAVLRLGNQLSYTAARPRPGTYYVRVRALNGRGSSDPSNEVVVTVRP
jgi:hypothetical protein